VGKNNYISSISWQWQCMHQIQDDSGNLQIIFPGWDFCTFTLSCIGKFANNILSTRLLYLSLAEAACECKYTPVCNWQGLLILNKHEKDTHRKCRRMQASDWIDWGQMMSRAHQRPLAAGRLDTGTGGLAPTLETYHSIQRNRQTDRQYVRQWDRRHCSST